ncbi:MAG: hypothetical protein LBI67_08940 [Treponema sp.]|nr:hypothetical protein [Treponema sp.]
MTKNEMIRIELREQSASLLALLCKRAFVERVMAFAADKKEAEKMLSALDELKGALEEASYV